MLQDRILIFDDQGKAFDAPGNLGTGKRSFAELTVDAPLGKLWSGLRVKFTGTLQRTRVEDPISGEMRKFSGFFPSWQWRVDVRRDAGKFSYGFNVNDNERFTFFRTDEFDIELQRRAVRNGIHRISSNRAHRDHLRRRQSVRNEREPHAAAVRSATGLSPVDVTDEFRERNRHRSFGLTLKQSFGGSSSSGVAKAD